MVTHKWLNVKQILEFLKGNKFETPGVISSAFFFLMQKKIFKF